MIKTNKYIEIVTSSNVMFSSMSKESYNNIYNVLEKYYKKVRISLIDNINDLEKLVLKRPDLVFLGIKFLPSDIKLGLEDPNKIWISSYLDRYGIEYTGSGNITHNLEFNKHLAKQCVIDANLSTSAFHVIDKNQKEINRESISLKFPLFIKPTNRGGGIGINDKSVVHNIKDLRIKVRSISNNLNSDSLIEEYLPGREFSVAILKNYRSNKFSIMPIELIAPKNDTGDRLLSKKVKSLNLESAIKVTDNNIKKRVSSIAISIFSALSARDYGRIDIRLDKFGNPQFLEANLIPSLIEGYGSFPKACMINLGLNYEYMILSIVRLGLSRKSKISDESVSIKSFVNQKN
jgi:D-alanine-D-alanine ligase